MRPGGSAASATGAARARSSGSRRLRSLFTLLTLWPARIAVYGVDLFRTGGNDYGRGDTIFGALNYAALVWGLCLVVVGVRAVHGWTYGRALGAVAIAAVVPALLVAATTV